MWNRWVVPWWIVAAVIVIVAGTIAYALHRQTVDRQEAIYNTAYSTCSTANEFRSFMADYLDSQVGVPVDQAPGYDSLSADAKALLEKVAPIIDAGRERRSEFAADYHARFPVQDCVKVAEDAKAKA